MTENTHGSTLLAIEAIINRTASVTSHGGFPSLRVEYSWQKKTHIHLMTKTQHLKSRMESFDFTASLIFLLNHTTQGLIPKLLLPVFIRTHWNTTCEKHSIEPTRKMTSLTRSDTLILNSPKSSVSSGTPSCIRKQNSQMTYTARQHPEKCNKTGWHYPFKGIFHLKM